MANFLPTTTATATGRLVIHSMERGMTCLVGRCPGGNVEMRRLRFADSAKRPVSILLRVEIPFLFAC